MTVLIKYLAVANQEITLRHPNMCPSFTTTKTLNLIVETFLQKKKKNKERPSSVLVFFRCLMRIIMMQHLQRRTCAALTEGQHDVNHLRLPLQCVSIMNVYWPKNNSYTNTSWDSSYFFTLNYMYGIDQITISRPSYQLEIRKWLLTILILFQYFPASVKNLVRASRWTLSLLALVKSLWIKYYCNIKWPYML